MTVSRANMCAIARPLLQVRNPRPNSSRLRHGIAQLTLCAGAILCVILSTRWGPALGDDSYFYI